jgi:hypothetical protein
MHLFERQICGKAHAMLSGTGAKLPNFSAAGKRRYGPMNSIQTAWLDRSDHLGR